MFKIVGPLDPEKDHFVGRAQELTQMSKWVESAQTYGLVLGASQTGKTSLLLKLQADLQPKYTCVYLNLQPFSDLDHRQAYQHLSEQIMARLWSKLEKKEWQVDYGLAFIRFLKQLSENIDSSRIVLLLDEMDALSQQSLGDLAGTIRGIFVSRLEEHELKKFVFIYAAATDVLTLTERRGSPLRNITECLYLDDLSRNETIQLLEHGFAQADIQIEEAIADHIYGLTHGHPYLTQALGNVLVEMKQKQKGDFRLTETSVDKAVQLLPQKGDPNLRHLVNALERAKRQSPDLLEKLRDILGSRVKIRLSRTNPELLLLELIGIIREDEDGYCAIRNQIYRQILEDILKKGELSQQTDTMLPEPAEAEGAEAVAELAKIKANLDRNAQKYAKRSLWLYLGMLAAIWLGLGILTWKLGWNKMEPWVCFIGVGGTLSSYVYFAITQNELSPGAIYDQIVESKKRKNYQAFGFDLKKYERLVK